jgi:citrate synthase
MESSRDTPFPERVRTRIWEELPQPGSDWLARGARCHGYALDDMARALDPVDTLYLLLRGELPPPAHKRLLARFLVSFCNPGPRHAATRAVMNAAASGTRAPALLPIGLALLGGEHLGSAEVERAVRFLARHRRDDATRVAAEQLALCTRVQDSADRRAAPGFGTLHAAADPFAAAQAALLLEVAPTDGALAWGEAFARALAADEQGWLLPGVAAAVCVDLGFAAAAAGLLFQYAALPGLMAHALEVRGKGITAMPFVPEARYELLGDGARGGHAA